MRGLRAIAAACVLLAVPAAGQGDDATLARGRWLVEAGAWCSGCHGTRGPGGRIVPGMELAGGWALDEADRHAVVPNITPDRATGIGVWTDAEIAAAIRAGRHRDGRPIGPPMPTELYSRISDRDVAAIVAYLRSVPAVAHPVTDVSRYRFAVPVVTPAEHVAPPADTAIDRGRYLAGLAHCVNCHTPAVADSYRHDWSRTGVGGVAFTGPWGAAVSANITSSPASGIGTWSDARIVAELTGGRDPDGRVLAPPMSARAPVFAQWSAADLADLVAFLRTLPPHE